MELARAVSLALNGQVGWKGFMARIGSKCLSWFIYANLPFEYIPTNNHSLFFIILQDNEIEILRRREKRVIYKVIHIN
jgi:hypothetical protein